MMQYQNRFTPTGIDILDNHIDNQLDILASGTRDQRILAAGKLQGIRFCLSAIDREKYRDTFYSIAEGIIDCGFYDIY